jgi:hypothetical protein
LRNSLFFIFLGQTWTNGSFTIDDSIDITGTLNVDHGDVETGGDLTITGNLNGNYGKVVVNGMHTKKKIPRFFKQ